MDNLIRELKKIKYVERWTEYRDDFFIRNDATGILKASFLIGYLCYVMEYVNDEKSMIRFGSKHKSNFPTYAQIIDTWQNKNKRAGFNYSGKGAMIFKDELIGKPYDELERGFIKEIQSRVNKIPKISVNRMKNVFKYTGYDPKHSVFTNVFFYHSLVMFGWYMCYGYYKNKKGEYVVKDFPGSCNVQGIINMYIFKLANELDKLVYTAHGSVRVFKNGAINPTHAYRQQSNEGDDVQFCHHGFRLYNTPQENNSSGYYPDWWVKLVRSHVDAFDILTLTPLFRLRQRLIRTGKGDRVPIIDKFIDGIQTNIKTFIKEHRLSDLPNTNKVYRSKRNNIIKR